MVTQAKRGAAAERDREATEQRLVDTIGQMVAETGFETIGVNAVAERAGISKILIYRYFGSLEGLMAAYIRRHDFWINFPQELPRREALPEFLKTMFRRQVAQLHSDPTLRRLCRWELSSRNELTDRLREHREKAGFGLVQAVSALSGRPEKEMAAVASLMNASITYLVMLEEFCPCYNGIRLDEEAGWEQLCRGIDTLVDRYFAPEGV